MSSSGSRGPPGNRYNERNEYNDYNKPRRKNFYSSSRRDFKSGGQPVTGGSKAATNDEPSAVSGEQRYSSMSRAKYSNGNLPGSNSLSRSSYNAHSGSRDSRNAYGSYNSNKSSYPPYTGNTGSNNYYSNYNNYGGFNGSKRPSSDYSKNGSSFYGGRNDVRRDMKKLNGESRLSSSNKPVSSSSTYTARAGNNQSVSGSSGEFQKERYDAYNSGDSMSNVSQSNKWRAYPSNSRFAPNGSSSGRPYSFKDRSRNYYGGSSALVNSGKRSDMYYPERSSNSLTNSTQYQKAYSPDSSVSKSNDESAGLKGSDEEIDEEDDDDNDRDIDSRRRDRENQDFNPNADDTTFSNADKEDNEDEEEDEMEEDEVHDNDAKSNVEVLHKLKEDISMGDIQTESGDNEEDEIDGNSSTFANNSDYPSIKTDDVDQKDILPNDIIKTEAKVTFFEPSEMSDDICYPEGCNFPLTELEAKFRNLEKEFRKKTEDGSEREDTTFKKKPIKDFSNYSFYIQNLQYFGATKEMLKAILIDKTLSIRKKRLSLWQSYSDKYKAWEEERKFMDKQLKILHPSDDEMRREIDSSDLKKQLPPQSSEVSTAEGSLPPPTAVNNRRNRRHGDLVTTEAEFQEILQSLGKEHTEDPLSRAERVAATIPDLILDPVERDDIRFMDANNIVVDKQLWSERVKTDFADNFSPSEHALFCEAFCMYPKRFGAISRHIGGLRTPGECVIHYYVTKKGVNYKHMLAQYRKKMSKKAGRKGKSVRSRNPSQTQTPVVTPTVEQEPMFDDVVVSDAPSDSFATSAQSDHFNEEIYSETGRRKRAAAPVFEGTGKKNDTKSDKPELDLVIPPKKKAKKKKEDNTPNQSIVNDIDARKPLTSSKDGTIDTESEISQDSDMKEKRKGISSYWSITEANSFPVLLAEHGTKWTTIADKLSTKTATMVRNYFQRNAEKNNWLKIAEEADARLEAKFAAVIGSRSEEEVEKPENFQYSQAADVRTANTPVLSQYAQVAALQNADISSTQQESTNSIGSIPLPSHPIVVGIKREEHAPFVSQQFPTPSVSHPHITSAISTAPSLEQGRSPTPPNMHRESKKASIMSLLNSDSIGSDDTQVTKPPQYTKNSLGDLLNTPSSPASQPIPNRPETSSVDSHKENADFGYK